jgi:hypothetical protein
LYFYVVEMGGLSSICIQMFEMHTKQLVTNNKCYEMVLRNKI